MMLLGLLLMGAAVIGVVAALFSTSGSASFLGADLGARTIFLLGLASGLALLWGWSLARVGAKRELRRRREGRRLRELQSRESSQSADATPAADPPPQA
jgi:uncharacterized membrane protein SpoIIM required for sporulation